MTLYKPFFFLSWARYKATIFISVWSPPGPTESNRAVYADAGLRIMEACLVNVFGEAEVAVVHPHDLEAVVGERTEIIGMGGHDYLGINPPTSEFVEMVNTGPPYNRVKFFELIRNMLFYAQRRLDGCANRNRDRKCKTDCATHAG